MCGIPFHACDPYITRLLKQGHKIAICEQIETPEEAQKRGHKSIVRRDVVRILTPGTIMEDTFLESEESNFYAALAENKDNFSVAVIDISTGTFLVESVTPLTLEDALSRLNPKEIILPEPLRQNKKIKNTLEAYRHRLTVQSATKFDQTNGERKLCAFFNATSLSIFGDFSDVDIKAAGGALEYVYLTQKESLPHLHPPKKIKDNGFLQIDAPSRASLELSATQNGQYKNSFLSLIDHTCTAGGQRLLSYTLAFPLLEKTEIEKRHDQVDFFVANAAHSTTLEENLKSFPDGERALARLSSNRGSARDLLVVRQALEQGFKIYTFLQESGGPFAPLSYDLEVLAPLAAELSKALKDEVGLLTRDGGFIRPHYHEALDRLQNYEKESKDRLIELQAHYAETTGISTLKIKHNQVIGYYIEVTQSHAEKVPETFIHRQSLMNSHRYTTPELLTIQEKLNSAQDEALSLELQLFDGLVMEVLKHQNKLRALIQYVSLVDMVHGFAHLATTHQYVRPNITTDQTFHVQKGRHPTIEILLKQKNEEFISNDCALAAEKNLVLLTGPNMGGKSTYLRQNALIIILAQMGAFVPAEHATLGLVDRIFSRVGAGDDLTKGRSTFMMEMIETASILHQATEKSFVILDEIGRGTSTFDGLAIAQATVEALHNKNKCRTLFATHYHELTALESTLDRLKCMAVQVKEWEGAIVFLHKISNGKSNQSYGVHVAELAGLPDAVTARARALLKSLESQKMSPAPTVEKKQKTPPTEGALHAMLKTVNPEHLSPRDALDLIFKLKEKMYDPVS